ncbi:hypothetical protein PGT21_035359 [Puccinia graminis f. sp. tritici]|uniref:Uncharacterized protein n=1 Tax=Puccinia graminis f. sp. tritici TaxID=56615 RepID=A0A5B0P3M8_PUCGR|nr:hypothetical protein PGT21_035359 [Puccinia graminis f. sp. tritici]
MYQLQIVLDTANPYAHFYRRIRETLSGSGTPQYVLRTVESTAFNPKTYNKPTVEEVLE